MKKFISILIILTVSVSLLLFTVSAETYEDFLLNLDYSVQQFPSGNVPLWRVQTINNKAKYEFAYGPNVIPMDYNSTLKFEVKIFNSTNSVFIKAGEAFDLSISGIFLDVTLDGTSYIWNKIPDNMYLELYYTDSTFTRFYDLEWSYNSGTNTQTVLFSGVAEKDVYKIDFYEDILQYTLTRQHGEFDTSIQMGSLDTATYLKVELESKEEALLGDISNELDNIANGTVEPDKSPADDKVNDVGQKEDQLLQDTAQGRENIVQYVTQAIAELSAYATAFVALNAIVDGFFYLPIIGPLIIISLSLGIFALIVNLAQTSTRSDKAQKPKGKGRTP